MRISDFGGESAIIKMIEEMSRASDERVAVGLGDDAALLRTTSDDLIIVTTDLLSEGTHFTLDTTDPFSLGWKAIAVNISDIAAMGGNPLWSFVSIALPDTDVQFVRSLYEGMNAISRDFDSAIIGGDTNRIRGQIVINVTQLGTVEERCATLRSGARPGDRILVTGTLGDSLAGFKLLSGLGATDASERHSRLVERHIRPVPRVREARAAVSSGTVSAMMDISDGLGIDLGKMCAASGVGARVSSERLPISDYLLAAEDEIGIDAYAIAGTGGEDYELLIAASPDGASELANVVHRETGAAVTDIGEFVEGSEAILTLPNGQESRFEAGWTHY